MDASSERDAENNEEIVLLPAERLLRQLLLDCRGQLEDPSSLEIWITGGWVRDRLLKLPSSDVDIAINRMTGKEFGEKLTTFINAQWDTYQKQALELGLTEIKFTGFNITKKNFEKSKRLETAVGRIFGLDLDLVNLRKEIYEEDSRTPEMEFGTAEEDAHRRDATVNSLFYNLLEQRVVDFTGMGIQDLSGRLMRTPFDPRQTFLEDPLRVLRLIRIGSKLGFQVESGAMASMKEAAIHTALNDKVSRERIGIEVVKMMVNPNVGVAFESLQSANLFETVFLGLGSPTVKRLLDDFPYQMGQPWPNRWLGIVQLVSNIGYTTLGSLKKMMRTQAEKDPEQVWTMVVYCLLAGFNAAGRRTAVLDASKALKMTKAISKLLDTAIMNFTFCQSMVREVVITGDNVSRGSLGLKIRKLGSTWEMQLLFAMLGEIIHSEDEEEVTNQDDARKQEVVQRYDLFLDRVVQLELQNVISFRPIIDGSVLKEVLGVKQDGPWLSGALENVMRWQLDHVGAQADQAKAWVLENREDFQAPPPDR